MIRKIISYFRETLCFLFIALAELTAHESSKLVATPIRTNTNYERLRNCQATKTKPLATAKSYLYNNILYNFAVVSSEKFLKFTCYALLNIRYEYDTS